MGSITLSLLHSTFLSQTGYNYSAAQGRSKDDKRKLPFLELNTKDLTESRIASPVSKKQLAPHPPSTLALADS